MNIFVTNKCPIKSARALDNKRVVKMCLETAQLLSTAIRQSMCNDTYCDGLGLYKATHANHPCTKWTALCQQNYIWTLEHFKALCAEYTARYGKIHASARLTSIFEDHIWALPELGHTEPTNFANCARNKQLGIDYTHIDDVVLAYQCYLADRWETDKRQPTWDVKG